MSPDDLKRLFPNASASTLRANLSTDGAGPTAVVERSPKAKPLAANQIKAQGPERLRIVFVSVRKRLLDPDNVCEKWMLDALRFVGAICGDEPDKIALETTQRKARKGEVEHTEITVYRL